jgi:thiol-disulfide isomerase/thioredoxin
MKYILFLSIIYLNFQFARCQNDIRSFHQTAYKSYHSDDNENSINYFDSIFIKDQTRFNASFNTIIKDASKGNKKALQLIEDYSKSKRISSKLIRPIHFYFKVKFTKEETLLRNQFNTLLEDIISNEDTNYFTGLYFTAAYLNIDGKTKLNSTDKFQILENLITLNNSTKSTNYKEIKHLKKYLKIILLNEFNSVDKKNNNEILSINTPLDLVESISEFSIISLKNNFSSIYSIKKKIIEKSIKTKKDTQKYLSYAIDLVNSYPSSSSLDWLKKMYNQDDTFQEYWLKNATANWKHFKGTKSINAFIDSNAKTPQWIVLDLWGTWCPPCVKELPKLAKMGQRFKTLPENSIQLLTLTFNSKNLTEFMAENKYTFPVLELNSTEYTKFGYTMFPTTLLISPDKKFIVLPPDSNKEYIISMYTYMEW